MIFLIRVKTISYEKSENLYSSISLIDKIIPPNTSILYLRKYTPHKSAHDNWGISF